MNSPMMSHETLETIQRETFDYFIHEANPLNGLIRGQGPGRIASQHRRRGVGPGGLSGRRGARLHHPRRMPSNGRLRPCGSSATAPKEQESEATGYKGFYYHFLDMKTGKRVWKCELSTVDTRFLLAGMLTAAAYFTNDSADEQRNPHAGRRAVPARRLAMGPERRGDGHARLEAGERLSAVSLARL